MADRVPEHFAAARPGPALILPTGLTGCYDQAGRAVPCYGSGQDGEVQGPQAGSAARFAAGPDLITDRLTGLQWSADASLAVTPLTWGEALDYVAGLNAQVWGGHGDWRLPNRRELRSLIDHGRQRPALPGDLPARNLFQGPYWTSTTAALHPQHAWWVDLAGGRSFYAGKDQDCMVWPVRRTSPVLPATGQVRCYDDAGREIPCAGSGQDGESRAGRLWPAQRFLPVDGGILDRLSGLVWYPRGDLLGEAVIWQVALDRLAERHRRIPQGPAWRLPTINELENLVDCGRHSPALPDGHPFKGVADVYWSSTTSMYEPDWAWALYLDKGAVGVGHKPFARFHVWPVRQAER